MRKTKLFKLLVTAVFFTIVGWSCHKQTANIEIAAENINLDDIKQWGKWYNDTYKGAPKMNFEKAEKGVFNNHFYVRVPLTEGGGMIYFNKQKSLEAIFIRDNPEYGSSIDTLTGFRDYINLNTFQITRLTYQKGKQIKIESSLQKLDASSDQVGNIRVQTTWFQQLLICLGAYLGLPARGADGDWSACWTLFGNNESGGDPTILSNYVPDLGGGYSNINGSGSFPNTHWTSLGGTQSGVNPEIILFNGNPLAPSTFIIDHYWEEESYDNNSYTFPPCTNRIECGYDQDGFRKNGAAYNYYGGTVQNYTNDQGGKYAVFTKTNGDKVKFPGATITDFGIVSNRGATTSNGGIHADLTFDLPALQHEYGHYLQAQLYGSSLYNFYIVPARLWDASINTPQGHSHFWTEVEANQLSINFFWQTSDIALNPSRFPR